MPRITIITPHFRPESGAAAKRLSSMADYLEGQGWIVQVVTLLPNYPLGKVYDGFNYPTPYVFSHRKVRIIRLQPFFSKKTNLLKRLLIELGFSIRVFRHARKLESDLILTSSPYMFLGLTGFLLGKYKKTPFVWDVRDLTWLYPRAVGKRTFGLDRLLEKIMFYVANKAQGLTTATEGIMDYFPDKPFHNEIVENGVGNELLNSFESLLDQDSDQKKKIVFYAGLLGYNHGLSTLIEAASFLPEATFYFAGDGPERSLLEEKARDLTNVHFLGHLSFDELKEYYAQASILVSHVRKNPIFLWTQPAKLWEYMATGKPVIHAGEGEVVEIIQKNDIALTVEPENPLAWMEPIRKLLNDPESAQEMGHRGRRFVEDNRTRDFLFSKLNRMLLEVLRTKNS